MKGEIADWDMLVAAGKLLVAKAAVVQETRQEEMIVVVEGLSGQVVLAEKSPAALAVVNWSYLS